MPLLRLRSASEPDPFCPEGFYGIELCCAIVQLKFIQMSPFLPANSVAAAKQPLGPWEGQSAPSQP